MGPLPVPFVVQDKVGAVPLGLQMFLQPREGQLRV